MVYQGSKTKYSKYIIPILQELLDKNNITTFIDAMCGGCNIVDKIQCENRFAYDKNPYLIDLYKEAVYNNLDFPEKITKEDWNLCKNSPDKVPKWKVALVAFFCSYSARGFCGGWAMNGTRDYYNERLRNFKSQIPRLKGITFDCIDIFNLKNLSNVLIYLDPPYKNTKKYDISKDFNYNNFWNKVRELSEHNLVIISEQEAPKDFKIIWEKEVKRNCFNANNKEAVERLYIIK